MYGSCKSSYLKVSSLRVAIKTSRNHTEDAALAEVDSCLHNGVLVAALSQGIARLGACAAAWNEKAATNPA